MCGKIVIVPGGSGHSECVQAVSGSRTAQAFQGMHPQTSKGIDANN